MRSLPRLLYIWSYADENRAMQSISSAFRDMYTSLPRKEEPEQLSRGFYVNVQYSTRSSSSTHSFFVQHMMTRLSTKTTLSSTAGLDEWARKRKLFPWVAIAAPLNVGLALSGCASPKSFQALTVITSCPGVTHPEVACFLA